MQVVNSRDNFSHVLGSLSLIHTSFSLKKRVELSLGRKLKNEVKVVLILKVIVKLDNIRMVELIHDLDFQLDLLCQLIVDDLLLVDHLDGIDVLGLLVPYFIHFSEPSNSFGHWCLPILLLLSDSKSSFLHSSSSPLMTV